ncbi:hypothetical protein HanIR_Chr02g0083301 [Helianthus annuus]|nr:hypothetical protein HanIR_Chr02g0083301 [Helianthus annuus]
MRFGTSVVTLTLFFVLLHIRPEGMESLIPRDGPPHHRHVGKTLTLCSRVNLTRDKKRKQK